MKIKVLEKCWYNKRYYNPETVDEDIIIDFEGTEAPVWGEVVNGKIEKVEPKKVEEAVKEVSEEKVEENDDKTKVNELPLVEKNALLEEAKGYGITGNNLLSFKVSTLKAKIAKAKEEKGE